jgi:AAA+ superfamily predicted ATPase
MKMTQIDVLVITTTSDILAEGIAAAVLGRADMRLVEERVLSVDEAGSLLVSIPPSESFALIMVGSYADTEEYAEAWLKRWPHLVVMCVDAPFGDSVHIALRDTGLAELLSELHALITHVGGAPRERVFRFKLRNVALKNVPGTEEQIQGTTVLNAALNWIHAVLRGAVINLISGNGDLPGFSVCAATIADILDVKRIRNASDILTDIEAADAELACALVNNDAQAEPLVRAVQVFSLTAIEFRMLLITLAPELDIRYQRCMGLLLDDMSRRVGTLGLYASLLGETCQIRQELARTGNLWKWRVFDLQTEMLVSADEPLRIDPSFVGWLLGSHGALGHDPRVRCAERQVSWPGYSLLDTHPERDFATNLIERCQITNENQWLVLGSNDSAAWRALIELGVKVKQVNPIRVDAVRLAGLAFGDIEESGVRLGRMSRLTESILVIDAAGLGTSSYEDEWMSLFFAAVASTDARAALISNDEARISRLLGSIPYEIEETTLNQAACVSAVRVAAKYADAYLTEEAAKAIATRYPMGIDGIERAMRLAGSKPLSYECDDPQGTRFIGACKEVAAEGVSHLAERIEPIFGIEDVVLPPDRKQQLIEIVDSIRLAPKVMNEWKFSEQLPYGRGVTVLFHGSSGTGKTMAAMGVAKKLGVQILRLDLSRVVSKYIGDTEKNIDQVFVDAERSGCAILIDEADALLGKRSEVKDAHDRYANIEIAYLLQRMEAYEGLAILTTNLRQNLDPAFLRRLRFIVDFPRPDADAREKIWRQCLPKGSHAIDNTAFRLLARRIDLTGGHIRQITIRAAFIAAASDTPIKLEHISLATSAELAKLGMPPVVFDLTDRRSAA